MKKILLLCLMAGLNSLPSSLYSQNSELIGTGANPDANWNVQKTNGNKYPTRAFGKPIQINGFTSVDKNNAKQAAIAFLKQEQATFGINPNTLEFKSERGFNKLHYVTFTQVYNGLEVLRTEVELRITNSGKVMAYGIKYYDDINLEIKPTFTASECVKVATKDIKCMKPTDEIQGGSRMFIMPVKKFGTTDYKLVYGYQFNADDNFNSYLAYVDAHSGEMVERKSLVKNASTNVKFVGSVNKLNPTDPVAVEPMPYLNSTVGTNKYTADATGSIVVDVTDKIAVKGKIDGKYASVTSSGKTSGAIKDTIVPNVDNTLSLDKTLSQFERNAYYYLNLGRNTLISIDPDIATEISDKKIAITLDYTTDEMNAASGGEEIIFYGLSQSNNRMLKIPDVLLHEYGHSINKFMYDHSNSNELGMLNDACNEALADIFSTYVVNHNILGLGYDSDLPAEGIRDMKNDNFYPDSSLGESHHDGLILSGTFWDLKELTSIDYLKQVSHFAKYGLPDDMDNGVAFSEWFVETLIADDNIGTGDADLSNGSPNFDKILTAFNNHKIGTDLFPFTSFSHTAIRDTADALKDYNFEYSFNIPNAKLLKVDSSYVVYSLDNLKTLNKIQGIKSTGNDYKAFVAEIPKGSYLKYYFETYINGSTTPIYYYKLNSEMTPYSALIGYVEVLTDNFETNKGWTFKASNDNATKGIWELNEPEEASQFSQNMLPDEDHSESGTKCLVTDPTFDMMFFMSRQNTNWTNGRTSVISPKYNTSQLIMPIVKYYNWFAYAFIAQDDNVRIPFEVYCSYDDGANWSLAYTTNTPQFSWIENVISVNPSEAFRIKFVANAPQRDNSELNFILKSYIDDFSIWSAGGAITSVDEAKSDLELKAFPNPAHTSVRFYAPHSNNVQIYNSLGELVKELEIQNGSAEWDRISNNNAKVPNGMYFCKTIANGKSVMKSVIIAD